jgi:tetratricopeptide (TPR) repeat protein
MAVEASQDSVFKKARSLHRSGARTEAIKLYRQVLKKEPQHVQALHMLGLAAYQQGDKAQAITLLQKAIAIKPDLGQAYYHLGVVLQSLNRFDEAIRLYRHAATLLPGSLDVHLTLGGVLYLINRPLDALSSYDKVSAINPNYADVYYNKGVVLQALNRLEEARANYQRAVALKPDLADARTNLGNVLQSLNRHAESLEHYRQAIAHNPSSAEAHMSLGNALKALNQFDDALDANARAAALAPNSALAHVNLGGALQLHGRYEEAIDCYAKALMLDPKLASAQMNYGTALSALNRYDDAMSRFDKALALNPNLADAAWNKSLLCLTLGRFEEGWPLYEARWPAAVVGLSQRKYPQPRWNGERLSGTLMIWGEQGLGDQILYASMLPEVVGHADRIIVEVEPRLVPLFARSFPELEVIGLGNELYSGYFNAHESLAGLGRFFRRSWDAFPRREDGYLVADHSLTPRLRERLSSNGNLVVGLSWRSSNPRLHRAKTARLDDFESLLRMQNLRFIDLQYGDTADERAEVEQKSGVRVERLDDIDNTRDVDGLAALISACDIVVTVSNTTAHLAGALGKPTFVLVPYGNAHLWYWFAEGDRSPWYPSVRLQRKAKQQTWAMMVQALAGEIAGFAAGLRSRDAGA